MEASKIINLGCYVPNPNDATSVYRGYGPIGHMQRHYPMSAVALASASIAAGQSLDAVFFQRPTNKTEVEVMQFFSKMRVPVIIDYDDYYLGVPADNPANGIYNNPETLASVKMAMEIADLVIVSTKELKRQFDKEMDSSKISVIRNALDERYFNESTPGTHKSIAWRGGMNHERDLREFMPFMQSKWPMGFYGFNPYFITGEDKNTTFVGSWANPHEFFDHLKEDANQIAVVPLRDSTFNRCKSNIAALEMIWSGAIPLVPDWEEWKLEGCISYSSPENFKSQLEELCNMPKGWYPEQHKKAWAYVQDQYTLRQVNPMRYEAICRAVENKS